MHRLTALELRSGVRSSSAISTQPSERTAKRMARSPLRDVDVAEDDDAVEELHEDVVDDVSVPSSGAAG